MRCDECQNNFTPSSVSLTKNYWFKVTSWRAKCLLHPERRQVNYSLRPGLRDPVYLLSVEGTNLSSTCFLSHCPALLALVSQYNLWQKKGESFLHSLSKSVLNNGATLHELTFFRDQSSQHFYSHLGPLNMFATHLSVCLCIFILNITSFVSSSNSNQTIIQRGTTNVNNKTSSTLYISTFCSEDTESSGKKKSPGHSEMAAITQTIKKSSKEAESLKDAFIRNVMNAIPDSLEAGLEEWQDSLLPQVPNFFTLDSIQEVSCSNVSLSTLFT